ncbi:hypothetical protein PV10_04047 [Exophiala mesophila]|uniref:AMP-dependent synthetase/ligase domain-containing protein n=1 Tax=Exophiala mesophila TaxID=212818 RepID=A0A0D1XX13_EXOME|nr:uncharacterized protein PV10_04047 [Exophiala mesophila]KIV92781.1 hypothetical protein PV10_04047 [Exophiala mesophila]
MAAMQVPANANAIEDVFFKPTKTVDIPTQDILSWIFDSPRYPQDQAIYVDPEDPTNSINIQQARNLTRRLIAGFRSTSLQTGDCICVHSFNNLYYSCVFLAVVGAGFVWAGTNPGYTDFELQHHLRTARAKLVLAEPELYDSIRPAANRVGIPDNNIFIFDWSNRRSVPEAPPRSWATLLRCGEQDWVRFNDEAVAKSTTACRLFSSGTTGLPKAAALSHYNLVAQHTLLQEQVQKPYQVKRILCLPFFHAAMVPIGHITPLRSGHVSYVMRRFHLEDFLRYTEKFEVTELFVVPPIVVSILQSPLIRRYSLRSLRCGMTGGAKIDLLSQQAFTALMHPDGSLNPCYGMTEISCIGACYQWPDQDLDGSVGHFLPNLEIRLVNDNDEDIRSYNQNGEICIRGPTVIEGYFDNPAANASSFLQGWFRTGDIAYCDSKSKKWYIVDRKKELIKVRGFQVAPPELEAVLMSHPNILDAAVIGIPAPSTIDGEVPRAYIVPRNPAAMDRSGIQRYVSERLAKYKQLSGGIVFVESLPKTASGKYLKRHLRDLWKRESQTAPKL